MSQEPRIAFVTLGCAKNEVDTDKMQARLVAAGFSLVDDVNDANLVIVNTCAFLASAVEESIEVIFDLVGRENAAGEELKVLVAGCMPSRYGDSLSEELVEAAGFLAAGEEDHVVEEVNRLLGLEGCLMGGGPKLLRHAHPSSAYVKISDGCDRFCSYCMIPHIRGRYHSYTLDQIDDEVAELVCNGVREIVLIGQDTGIWGSDFDEPATTAQLLETLARRYPETWFRLLYVQPEGITDELLDAVAEIPNVCSYLDMPLQHVNAEVLARMNRSGNPQDMLALIERVRAHVPGIMMRTTLMAGFPGETEEQFEELLDFVDEAQFDYAGVFAFSPEEGSAAYELDGLLDDDERMERAQRLLDACEAIGTARVSTCVDTYAKVLVEGYEETDAGLEALCRTQGQAPEVDGQVHVPIKDHDELKPGQFAQVKLTGSFFYEIEGELADHAC